MTDHGTVAGTYAFHKACEKAGVKDLLGMEAYYTIEDKAVKEKDADGESYYHLVLLAQNNNGLKNLFKLSTKAYTEGLYRKPRCDNALLEECCADIIATSSCLGSRSSQLILKGRVDEAERLLDYHAQLFKDRFFIEVQLHADREQQLVNKELIRIAGKRNLPLVLTNDCHYCNESEKNLHEQALCMQTNDVMTSEKRFSFGTIDVHVASHDWMWSRAQQQQIPYEAISNTNYVASLVNNKDYFADTWNRYPKYQKLPDNLTSWQALENLAKNMLAEKFNGQIPQKYKDRMNSELLVIKRMGFSDYLLIVQDFINQARDENILVGPGRGSAASSLVVYALGITQIDPIKYNLLFNRFLNPGRAGIPIIF